MTETDPVCVGHSLAEKVFVCLPERRERAMMFSRDDRLHLAPGQPMKRTKFCGSLLEEENHQTLQLDVLLSSLVPAAT